MAYIVKCVGCQERIVCMESPKLKIFTIYNNEQTLIKSDIITPLQVGCALSNYRLGETLYDDTGDNISVLNKSFCELTGIYWVWKNYDKIGDPNYVGFMHYRRHFLFGHKEYIPDWYGLNTFPKIDENYLKEDITDDVNILSIVTQYDAIVPRAIDVKKTVDSKNNYEHFKHFHDIKDLDAAMKILKEKYPEYSLIAKEYDRSTLSYFLNMFIFTKDLFFRYCEFIFSILFELQTKIDLSKRDDYQLRVFGFVAERLTGIFIKKLYSEGLNIKELPVSIVGDTHVCRTVVNTSIVPIVVASSNEYVPVLSVFLESLKAHVNHTAHYEVNVLERNISNDDKMQLKKMLLNTNIDIRFINLGKRLNNLQSMCVGRHFTVETYSRLFAPELLPEYNKCLYLDLDILILDDLKKLFEIDIEDKAIAACVDNIFVSFCNNSNFPDLKTYIKTTLKLDNPEAYFQNGVLMLNLEKMRKNNVKSKLLDCILNMKVHFADQCVFNFYFRNDVKYIPTCWNYGICDRERRALNVKETMPLNILKQYISDSQNPKIIHYSGPYKPWFYPDEEYAKIWWEYARRSPYYEQLLKKMSEHILEQSNYMIDEKIAVVKNYKKICLKYWKAKFLEKITFGKRKIHYYNKKLLLKDKIRLGRYFYN